MAAGNRQGIRKKSENWATTTAQAIHEEKYL